MDPIASDHADSSAVEPVSAMISLGETPDSSGSPHAQPVAQARIPLGRRLTLALVLMAALSTTFALFAQDLALTRDLENAAATRLERSARAGQRVVEEHLNAVGQKYRAIARTPQLRATLELNDRPTLLYLADELARQHGARAIAFFDTGGRLLVGSGEMELLDLAPGEEGDSLQASVATGDVQAVTRVLLETRGQSFGSLVAIESIDATRLDSWSELCGATIALSYEALPPRSSQDRLTRPIIDLGYATLEASSGLEAEHAAVRASRVELIRAGSVTLLISILGCFGLARSLVRPIEEIQRAVERIRHGDLSASLRSERNDEIGDVARGINRMASDLEVSRAELDLRIDELDRSRTHLANAQRLARIGSLEIDLQSGTVSGSQEFFALLGLDDPSRGRKIEPEALLELVHEEDRESVRDTVAECIQTGFAARIDHRMVIGEAIRVMHTQFQVIRDEAQQATHLEGTLQDVTERRRAEKQIQFLAYHDSLTGLGNRLHMKERLEIAITQARRRRQRCHIGVLFLDLDHFKRINDTLGHDAGDDLLQRVADRLISTLRVGDEIGRGFDASETLSLSRLGGDEFTLMISDLDDPRAIAPIAQRILDALGRPFVIDGKEIVIGASIGIAVWPQDGNDVDTLLRNADSAMYHVKSDGRGTYSYYEESMNSTALHRLEIESRLRRAIDEETLEVAYQPRVEIATQHVIGFEALCRWNDPELGRMSPAEFIPIAEQADLIVSLGRFVLREACRQAAAWERDEFGFSGRISVNVSARQFKAVDVAREIRDVLAETRVNPLRLEIEVTESVVLHDEERVIEMLHEIREMGVTIALDDFGTGYSSLSYLRRLPVDVLKIDMAFIRGIARNREDAALARAIVAMADALGLDVVAEGVESPAQRDLLRSWGCEEMQGFLFSPAVPAEEASGFRTRPGDLRRQEDG